jgi:hypothetical protein
MFMQSNPYQIPVALLLGILCCAFAGCDVTQKSGDTVPEDTHTSELESQDSGDASEIPQPSGQIENDENEASIDQNDDSGEVDEDNDPMEEEQDPAPPNEENPEETEGAENMEGTEGTGPRDNNNVSEEEENPASIDGANRDNYVFSHNESLLYIQVFRDASALGGHDHVVRATNWSGALNQVEGEPGACDLSYTLTVGDLVADESAMRDLVGYNDTISESDRAQIRENMLALEQLNAVAHPIISFSSTSCQMTGGADGTISATGQITIRGQTKQIEKEMPYTIQDGSLFFSGSLSVTHSDFGFAPYSALFGVFKNAEEMQISIDAMGIVE